MRTRWLRVIVVLMAGGGWPTGRAQPAEPLVPAVPLMSGEAVPADGVARALAGEGAARRALELGFPGVAAGLYAELAGALPPGPERDRLVLDWTIALIEIGRLDEAAAALATFAGERTPQRRLRRGLLLMARGDAAGAEAAINGVVVSALPPGERAWLHYLAGLVADAAGQPAVAHRSFQAAMDAAASPLQAARFRLANLRSELRSGVVTEEQLAALRQNVQRYQGQRLGFDYAKPYAAALAATDQRVEAVAFLQQQLNALPTGEVETRDAFRLLLGMIAGAEAGPGRAALFGLLRDGVERDRQRVAVRLLAAVADDAVGRRALRNELSQLLERAEQHPIEEDLLVYRAQLALAVGDEEGRRAAQLDAQAVLERYPASRLKPLALGVLVSAAWDGGRYRTAANYAEQARREMTAGEARAQLGVLRAEAFFRAGDFSNAATAYATALDELPAGASPGVVIFQEILARVEANQLTEAAARLDALAGDSRLDTINRWQAEWNLARALQADGRSVDALARVNVLLSAPSDAVDADLLVRLSWLQARLALDVGAPEQTLAGAPALRVHLAEVGAVLRVEVASSLRLLEAEAHFALGEGDAAMAALQLLRDEYPDTDAAVYSYIVQANAATTAGQLVEAQRLLRELVKEYSDNRYAPYALFQSALTVERRGQDRFRTEAITLIEELVSNYPQSELVFYARFKQGDLLRELGHYGLARQVYERIVNDYPQHRDVLLARMALADSMEAQASTDASLHESAAAIYDSLRDLPTARPELRIEAGFRAGWAMARRGLAGRAEAVWWQVINDFLLVESTGDGAAEPDLGTKGRFWLFRTVSELGGELERQGRLEEARQAYRLIATHGLPGERLAWERLAALGALPAAETALLPEGAEANGGR